jgi:hypothetical protein
MDQQLSALVSALVSAAVRAWTSLVHLLRKQIAIDVRTYRPEKHYMRGPGPKWREKPLPYRGLAGCESEAPEVTTRRLNYLCDTFSVALHLYEIPIPLLSSPSRKHMRQVAPHRCPSETERLSQF